MKTVQIAGVECLVREGDPEVGTIVVFHGFGSNAYDMASLAESIDSRAQWVFPQGIVPLFWRARAWWKIKRDGPRDLGGPMSDGAAEAVEKLLVFFQELGATRLVIAGFSQGAMISSHLALRLPEPPAGLILFSGTALDVDALADLAPGRAGLRFFQSHGAADPILPLPGARRLFDTLQAAGLDGDFHEFPGDHHIPPEALRAAADYIDQVLAS